MLSYFLKPLLNQALRLMIQSVFVHAVVEKFLGNQFGQSISSQKSFQLLHLLDFCLVHCLLSSDSKAMAKVSKLHVSFFKIKKI